MLSICYGAGLQQTHTHAVGHLRIADYVRILYKLRLSVVSVNNTRIVALSRNENAAEQQEQQNDSIESCRQSYLNSGKCNLTL